MEGWGGAQWVLATLMALAVVLPIPFCIFGLGLKTRAEWWAWYGSKVGEVIGLTLLLAWGGFWTPC